MGCEIKCLRERQSRSAAGYIHTHDPFHRQVDHALAGPADQWMREAVAGGRASSRGPVKYLRPLDRWARPPRQVIDLLSVARAVGPKDPRTPAAPR